MVMDPWSIFLYGMKAPMIREKHGGRLSKFFDFISLTGGTMEERAKAFTERSRRQPKWVFQSVLRSSPEALYQSLRWRTERLKKRLHDE
jgi:hypothetical protein